MTTHATYASLLPMTASATRAERFDAFVASHRPRAVRVAMRLVGGDAHAAEDVAQQAFVKAWRALPRFRDDSSMSTWFYRILVRTASNHRRWRSTRARWAEAFRMDADPVAISLPDTIDPALRERIRTALGGLTEPQRTAFVLVNVEQLTVAEAAEWMGSATGTVKSHLHRARVALRSALADEAPR